MTATITPLPPAPNRGEDSDIFSNKVDNLLGALDQFVAEANILIAGADADSANATAAAITAINSASAAANSAATALVNTNIPRWVSGTTYAADATVISPATNLTYRRRAAGAGTTDPSADQTNWQITVVMSHPFSTRASNFTMVPLDRGAVQTCSGTITATLPASSVVGNGWFTFVTNNGSGVITVAANGAESINGASTLTLYIGETAMIVSDGANPRAYRFVPRYADTTSSVAAATTIDIRDLGSNVIHVTGTAYVTGILIATGQVKTLISDAGFTLGYAGGLVTPYFNDLIVNAGQMVTIVGDAGNTPRVLSTSATFRPYIHVRDEKTANTAGGASAAGDNTRTLNAVVLNTINSASLAANVVTLPAGNYTFKATAPVSGNVGTHRISLYNNTDSQVIAYGTPALTSAGTMVDAIEGRFAFGSPKAITLRQRITTAVATSGLGVPMNDGGPEVYATLQIWKET